MAFADIVVQDGLGEVYKLDVSLDGFSTISYRYATASGVDASSDYDPRIVNIGPIQRGLGMDFAMQAGSVEVTLANDDAGADWLCLYESANALKARFRLYLGIYVLPFTSASNIQWKQLGEFSLQDFPAMDAEKVTLTLDDDAAGLLDAPPHQPTLRNWTGTDTSYFTNLDGLTLDADLIRDFPIPLAWGTDWAQAHRVSWFAHSRGAGAEDSSGSVPFVVCATADTAVSSYASDVLAVKVHLAGTPGGLPVGVPASVFANFMGSQISLTVWEGVRSPTFTDRDGRSWRAIYVQFNEVGFSTWLQSIAYVAAPSPIGTTSVPGQTEFDSTTPPFGISQIQDVWVQGFPLSGKTINTDSRQRPSDIVTDLCTHYYADTAIPVDSTSLARVKAAFPSHDATGLTGGPYDKLRPMREVFSDIADSWDLDIFIRWDGTLGMSSRVYDYDSQTDTLLEIPEERISDFRQSVPPREARFAPYNRVEYRDTKQDHNTAAAGRTNVTLEAGDDQTAQTAWRRTMVRRRGMRWQPTFPSIYNPTGTSMDVDGRPIDSTIRPLASFRTDMEAMQLELGDYFKLTWTRNKSNPYVAAIFRVEELTLVPNSNSVLVKAIYADDLRTKRPYLLDNETYLSKATGSGGRTVNVVDTSDTATFSSGSLITDGIESGDHLILKDAAEGATGFQRNRALKILNVLSATTLEVDDPDLDFGGGGTFSGWEIRRSHLTYHYASTDPTNYPDGGYPYGRVADADSYSDVDPEGVVGLEPHRMREG